MSNLLLLNFDSKINLDKNATSVYWNLNFNSKKNSISIPNEINNNAKIYRESYLSYLDRLNDHFKNIKVDKIPYWLLSSIACKQGSFTNPFEIKNAIKFIYFESLLKRSSFKRLILTGSVDNRIILVLKPLLKKYNIEYFDRSSKERVNALRKYLSILKTLLNLALTSSKKKQNNIKINTLLVDYSSSKNQINYWNRLIKNFNPEYTLKLNVDIDSKTSNYSTNDHFNSVFLYNNFSLKESIRIFLDIIKLYKTVKNRVFFDYNKSLNFWPIYSELIFKDFVGSNALFNSITMSSVKNLYKNNPNISLILYPRENQAWERILLFYSNKNSVSIGNFHAGFKYWDLRNYLNESDYLRQNQMKPSIFSIYSKTLIDILSYDKNFRNENFELVESLRLKNFKKENNSLNTFRGLVVILDYDKAVSIKQIELVLKFMKKGSITQVVFKAHINNYEYLSKKYKSINFQKDDIEKLINTNSHFFCSNNTTLSVELISSGCNTSIMDSGTNLDMDPSKIYGLETIKIKSEDDLLIFINSNQNNQSKNLFELNNDFPLWKKLLISLNNELILN